MNGVMRKRIFVAGFGLSLLLLGICAAYGCSPKWRPAVMAVFEDSPWYVGLPVGLRYSVAIVTLLNPPAVLAASSLVHMMEISPIARAGAWLALSATFSLGWWLLVAWAAGIATAWMRRLRVERRRP